MLEPFVTHPFFQLIGFFFGFIGALAAIDYFWQKRRVEKG